MVLRQALLDHEFFHVGPRGLEERAATGVRGAWDECGRSGMDRPVSGVPSTDMAPLPGGPAGGYRVLAARQQEGDGIRQALLYQTHDVLGAAVLLAPDGDGTPGGEPSWRLLETARPPAAAPGGLGAARVLLGITAHPLSTGDDLARVGALLPDLVAGARPGRWQYDGRPTGQGFAVWEIPQNADPAADAAAAPPRRRLVVLAPVALERELDAWAWHSRDRLAPLTRYLLHAAKLRYQAAVFDASRHRELRRRVEEATDRARTASRLLRGNPRTALREALDTRAVLVGLRTDTDGLITAAARLRVMSRTVRIARANLAAAVAGGAVVLLPGAGDVRDTGGASRPAGAEDIGDLDNPFGNDERLGLGLERQLDDDAEYLAATLDSSAEVAREAAALVESHLADHRAQLALLQSSLLGALLMSLTVVQAFGYRVPIPGPLQAPVIAVLAALALLLPVAAAGWSRSTVRQGPFRALTHTLPATVGAAVGWLLATLAAEWAYGTGQRAAWSTGAAATGAVAAVAVGLLAGRRVRRSEGSPVPGTRHPRIPNHRND
ncbi:CATRA conflict system CASPASE/TPR repeat-associated protein [Streptomyces sp. NPDC001153]